MGGKELHLYCHPGRDASHVTLNPRRLRKQPMNLWLYRRGPWKVVRPPLVYTDGSGFEGHIGAAAVNIHDLDAAAIISDRRHLGTESQSTVYAAELSGIEMALARAIKHNKAKSSASTHKTAREVIILSDSQAAIQAVQNPQRPSGQYVLRRHL